MAFVFDICKTNNLIFILEIAFVNLNEKPGPSSLIRIIYCLLLVDETLAISGKEQF